MSSRLGFQVLVSNKEHGRKKYGKKDKVIYRGVQAHCLKTVVCEQARRGNIVIRNINNSNCNFFLCYSCL